MLKKTVTYTNLFTDETVSEDLYFHISKADLVEMEMENHSAEYTSKEGTKLTGMQAHLQRIVDSENGPAVLKEFREILRRAYGKKVGERFVKNPGAWAEFEGSEAYSEFVFNLLTDADELAKFIQGILPNNLEQEAARLMARAQRNKDQMEMSETTNGAEVTEVTRDTATPDNPYILKATDLIELDKPVLNAGIESGAFKMPA